MRRVLFLAYHFPPVGGSGVQRSLAFVRYLRESGYEPVVVTGPGPAGGRWTPADPSLADDLPADLEVLRLGPEPEPAGRGGRRAERLLGLESRFARWWVEGAVAAGRRASGIDLVYASMCPFETAGAAAALSRALGRPWVADLRDPWALDELAVYPSAFHRRRELRRMRRLLGTASVVVMNTEEAARAARERFPELAGRVSTIPNGFDASSFMAGTLLPEAKVAYVPGATFFPVHQQPHHARVSFSGVPDERLVDGITALGRLLSRELSTR